MSQPGPVHRFSKAEAIYAGLLELYPADFRQAYSEEMLHLFSENWERVESASFAYRFQYSSRMLADWVLTMGREWFSATRSWEFTLGSVSLVYSGAFYLVSRDFVSVINALFISFFALLARFVLLSRPRVPLLNLVLRAIALGAGANFLTARMYPSHSTESSYVLWSDPTNLWSTSGGTIAFVTAAIVLGMSDFHYRRHFGLKQTLTAHAHCGWVNRVLYNLCICLGLWNLIHHQYVLAGISLTFLIYALSDRLFRLWIQPTPHYVPEPRTFD